ncbi:hypothetical protein D3C80_724900 [compost metagenome]
MGLAAHGAQGHRDGGEDEGEFADLSQGGGDGQAGRTVQLEGRRDGQSRQRLADDDDAQDAQNGQGLAHQDHGVEQHADRDEEEDGEGVAQRQGPLGRIVAQGRAVQHQTGQEGAQGEGVEQVVGDPGDAQGDGQHAQGEQFARLGVGDPHQHPGQDLGADHQHDADEDRDLEQGPADGLGQFGSAQRLAGRDDQQRHHDQGDDDDQVLDDQPAHGDATCVALELFTLLQRAQQDHGRGHGQGEAQQQGLDVAEAEQKTPKTPAEHGRRADLNQGAGNGDLAHLHQVRRREVQPDPEHQQDDADLGQLGRQFRVRDEAARVGADDDARHQITDQRRQLQPIGQHAEHEGEDEASDQGDNQAVGMRHRRSCVGEGSFGTGNLNLGAQGRHGKAFMPILPG